MRHMVFEFNTELELKDTVKALWDNHGVSGEMGIRPLKDGRWRLEFNSERDIRDSVIDKFTGYRVEAGD